MDRVGPGFQAPNYFGPWIPADKIDDFEISKKNAFRVSLSSRGETFPEISGNLIFSF